MSIVSKSNCYTTWKNQIDGQVNLYDATRGQINYTHPVTGKTYSLRDDHAVLNVRPRGWHMEEKHVSVHNKFISASLFDFGIFVFNNARVLIDKGSGPYFYLPKIQNKEEAALWADVFKFTENKLNLPKGSIKCTVLIEHLLASFEMEEIVYNLKDYIIGLNCGRWDYIFSYIKCFRNQLRITPDRLNISMTTPFLKAYSQEVIRTSHRRGIFAMGGMAAAIPNRADAVANNKALQSVINDKERESSSGHDGTWVAHPGLVPLAMKVFDEAIEGDNQIHRQLEGYITNKQLTEIPRGPKTSLGLRNNISVTLQYLEAWLRGIGCVAINNSMEDAATAEICRAQLWQWINHGVKLDDGTIVTPELVKNAINQEMETRMVMVGSTSNRLVDASVMLEKFVLEETLSDFLTLDAYDKIVSEGR